MMFNFSLNEKSSNNSKIISKMKNQFLEKKVKGYLEQKFFVGFFFISLSVVLALKINTFCGFRYFIN